MKTIYRLLIIDDEPDIVNGLYNFFFNYEELELDVFKSYSAYEALDILNSERIDIVISDICMPGMDGLALVKQVRKNWPYCQVIFLSGYTEFEYIYGANQLDAVNYILKTEGYEKVAESVHKAAENIRNAIKLSRINASGLEFKHEFVSFILDIHDVEREELKQVFENMNIRLDPGRPVFFMVGCFTNISEKSPKEQTKVYAVLNRLSGAHILPYFNLLADEYEKNIHIFIMQPAGTEDDSYNIARIKGLVEIIQNSLAEELGFNMSFFIYDIPLPINELSGHYKKLRQLISGRGVSGIEIIIIGSDDSRTTNHNTQMHSIDETRAIVIVKEYIANNLERELSLTQLANLVYFNPSYLSRIFKNYTGVNLIRYITNMRIAKAKELLTNSNMKINSIAAAVGFDSQSYFNQAFRKSTGLSPSEYRSSHEYRSSNISKNI